MQLSKKKLQFLQLLPVHILHTANVSAPSVPADFHNDNSGRVPINISSFHTSTDNPRHMCISFFLAVVAVAPVFAAVLISNQPNAVMEAGEHDTCEIGGAKLQPLHQSCSRVWPTNCVKPATNSWRWSSWQYCSHSNSLWYRLDLQITKASGS